MENVIGLVVFLLIAVFSAISNSQKKKQDEEQQKKSQQRRTRPEDLPEATRRMLYGDADVAPREAIPREAQPRPAVPERQKPVPLSQESNYAPRVARQAPAAPQHVPHGTDPAEMARQRMQQQMQQALQQAKQREAYQRQTAEQAARERARQQDEGSPSTTRKRRSMAKARGPERKKASAARLESTVAPVSARNRSLRHVVFGDMRDVRRAIILQEVLGPPKGFQP